MAVIVLHGAIDDAACATALPAIRAALPSFLRARVDRCRQSADRQRSLLGYALVDVGLRRLGYQTVDWQQLQVSAFGRPRLPLPVDFNVSHAGERVVCALSSDGDVGIDIEPLRTVDLQGMDAYMNEAQWRAITASADASATFLDYWTVKESVVKCDGTGLSLPVREIVVAEDQARFGAQTWQVRRLTIAPGYVSALATTFVPQVALSHWQT